MKRETFYIEDKNVKHLKELAYQLRTSKSKLVNMAIERFISQNGFTGESLNPMMRFAGKLKDEFKDIDPVKSIEDIRNEWTDE